MSEEKRAELQAPAPEPTRRPAAPARPGDAGAPERSRAVGRRDFELVIRRAAELTLRDTDADEQLSEDEVLRIATELGLPAHHVQRALYELPELSAPPKWYDAYFGPAIFSVARVVPGQAPPTLKRLEDYLVTREYLQIVRRRSESLAFMPAEDTISSIARAFFRSGNRHHIAKASRVVAGAHPMPDEKAHVRLDVDLSGERRESLRRGVSLGVLGGFAVGTLAAAATGAMLPAAFGPVPEILAFGGGLSATATASFSIAARNFRQRVASAKFELSGLLDRIEHGERLDPPPAPWRRKLQLRVFGSRLDR